MVIPLPDELERRPGGGRNNCEQSGDSSSDDDDESEEDECATSSSSSSCCGDTDTATDSTTRLLEMRNVYKLSDLELSKTVGQYYLFSN